MTLLVDTLERASALAAEAPIAQHDTDELVELMATVRALERSLAGLLTRVAARADELAAQGCSPPGFEILLGGGEVQARTARRHARRARLVDRCPQVGELLSSGTLGVEHLDQLVSSLGRLDDDQLAQIDLETLVADAERLPADTFLPLVRRAVDEVLADEAEPRSVAEVRHWFDRATGLGHIHARLDAERYESVANAIDQHVNALAAAGGDEPRVKGPNLAADALVELITSSGGRAGETTGVTIVIDHQTFTEGLHDHSICESGDGRPVGPEAVERLSCDAILRWVRLDPEGVPVNVGRRHRTATDAQWAALRSIHSSCAWPGCERPLSHCQAHHIVTWLDGGPTDLDNLIPLCSHHHHRAHEGRWRVELGHDRRVSVSRPDGTRYPPTPPATRAPTSTPWVSLAGAA